MDKAAFAGNCPRRQCNIVFRGQLPKGDELVKLLDQLRQLARAKHFSYRTEQANVYWAERYIRFLTHRAVKGKVSCLGTHFPETLFSLSLRSTPNIVAGVPNRR